MATALLAHTTLQVCQGPSLPGTAQASPEPAPGMGCTARGCSVLGPRQDRQSLTAPWHPGQPSPSDGQIAGDESGPCMGLGSCWSQRLNNIWQRRTCQCLSRPPQACLHTSYLLCWPDSLAAPTPLPPHSFPAKPWHLPSQDGKGNLTHLSTHEKGLWPGSLRGGLPLPGRSVL